MSMPTASQSVQALHQQISNLEPVNMGKMCNLVSMVHDTPVSAEKTDLISRYAAIPSTRSKIVGKKPKEKPAVMSGKMRASETGIDRWNASSALDDFYTENPSNQSFSRTTAEGLYKREHETGTFQRATASARYQARPAQIEMKYDFTPSPWG